MNEYLFYTIKVAGLSYSSSGHFLKTDDYRQVAVQLTRIERQLPEIEDEREVEMVLTETEKYLPPRCKKPRTRIKEEFLANYTMGELRQLAVEFEKAE